MPSLTGTVLALAASPGLSLDSRFGAAGAATTIYGHYTGEYGGKEVAFLLAHPSGNFFNHYLLQTLGGLGASCLALNTRYVGNETSILMEMCVLDIAVGVEFLRQQGFRRVVLVGNSGGGSLAAFYQSQAENPTLSSLPDGTPFRFDRNVPPADAIVLLAAHPGRAEVLTDWLDPSVTDEKDPFSVDPSLDMFEQKNGPPYSEAWLKKYRAAQVARNARITAHVLASLDNLKAHLDASDLPLLVYRTGADPRFLDVSIDRNDRTVQAVTAARASNYAAVSMGRLSTMQSWLSQWSLSHSRANGPKSISMTTVPVLIVGYSADSIVFPSQTRLWVDAVGSRGTGEVLEGATHFLRGQSELQKQIAQRIVQWSRATFL
jgi:pimeloyl-ACP methyl ester carboxylesterase